MGEPFNKDNNLQVDNKELEGADKVKIRIVHNRQGEQVVLATRPSGRPVAAAEQQIGRPDPIELHPVVPRVLDGEETKAEALRHELALKALNLDQDPVIAGQHGHPFHLEAILLVPAI